MADRQDGEYWKTEFVKCLERAQVATADTLAEIGGQTDELITRAKELAEEAVTAFKSLAETIVRVNESRARISTDFADLVAELDSKLGTAIEAQKTGHASANSALDALREQFDEIQDNCDALSAEIQDGFSGLIATCVEAGISERVLAPLDELKLRCLEILAESVREPIQDALTEVKEEVASLVMPPIRRGIEGAIGKIRAAMKDFTHSVIGGAENSARERTVTDFVVAQVEALLDPLVDGLHRVISLAEPFGIRVE